MLGTVVNTFAIAIGSVIGSFTKNCLKDKYQEALFHSIGLCTCCLGINMFCSNLPNSKYPVLFIIAIAIGSLIGTWLDLDTKFNKLTSKAGGESLGLSTAILLFCVGTLSILGPVQSALYGNNTLLFTNAALDFITSIILSCAYGIRIIWSGVVLFLWQGSIYSLSLFLGKYMSNTFFCELSIIGGLLILGSGLSILKIKDIKTMNILPSLFVVPIIWIVLYLLGF
jgi:hypothetical protein